MIRRACLTGLAALAFAGQAGADTPMETALAACGGTRVVLSAEAPTPEQIARSAEVLNARLGGGLVLDYVAPGADGGLVISLPASDVDPTAFAPILKRGELGFYSVVGEGGDAISVHDSLADRTVWIDPDPILTGDDLAGAQAVFDYTNQPAIEFRFTPDAAQVFGDYTAAHIGDAFAIIYDGALLTAPIIQTAIPGGSGIITGAFGVEETNEMAVILSSGMLPLDWEIRQIEQVDSDPEGDRALCPVLQ